MTDFHNRHRYNNPSEMSATEKKFSLTRQVLFLLQSAYQAFKLKNPIDEPYWKIYCVKKTKERLSRSDLDFDWRQKIIKHKNNDRGETYIEEKEEKLDTIMKTGVVKKTLKQTVKEYESDDFNTSKTYFKRSRPELLSIKEETYVETAKGIITDIQPSDCEITTFEPAHEIDYINTKFNFIKTIACPTIIPESDGFTIIDGNDRTDITPILKTVEIKMVEDRCERMKNQLNSLTDKLKALNREIIDKINLFKQDFDNMRADLKVQGELTKSTIEAGQAGLKEIIIKIADINTRSTNELTTCDVETLKRANMISKKERTATQVIEKYLEIQQKLNDLKSQILPVMRKHQRLKIDEVLKNHSFIDSIAIAIRHYDDEYETEDEDYNYLL
jgi:hypothetical protein